MPTSASASVVDPEVGLILLAAGQALRFGGGKLVAPFRGRALWEWAAVAAETAGFTRRYLVVAPDLPLGRRKGWELVVNPRAVEGMGTSIAAGVAAAHSCRRIVIALADMPLIEPAHLQRLAEAQGSVFTRYPDGRSGSPAAFSSDVFDRLETLDGDRGARSLDLGEVQTIAPDQPINLTDVDTRGDLAALA